jgi:hypothetical protein
LVTLSDDEIRELMRFVRAFSKRREFPVDDPEFGSAIGHAVFLAMQTWRPDRGRTLRSLACLYARREFTRIAVMFALHEHLDFDPIKRESRVPLLSQEEFSALEVAATFGRMHAAKLLGVSPSRLRDLIDQCRERMQKDA